MEFLTREVALAIHDAQLAAYGGLSGVRDDNLFESALARPQNKFAYGEEDVYALAATLCFGMARNHPFLDANKRTAWSCTLAFLRLNGAVTPKPSPSVVIQMIGMAEGSISEDEFADWLRQSANA